MRSNSHFGAHVVPPSGGIACGNPTPVDLPTPLRPQMIGIQNEQTKREALVAGPMNCIAVLEVARQEAMFTTRCGKSVRKEVHWKNC